MAKKHTKKIVNDEEFGRVWTNDQLAAVKRKGKEKKNNRDKDGESELQSGKRGMRSRGVTSKNDKKLIAERLAAKQEAAKTFNAIADLDAQKDNFYQELVFQGEPETPEAANAFLERYDDIELSAEELTVVRAGMQYAMNNYNFSLFYKEDSGNWIACTVSKNTRSGGMGQRFRFLEKGSKRSLESPSNLPAHRLVFERKG